MNLTSFSACGRAVTQCKLDRNESTPDNKEAGRGSDADIPQATDGQVKRIVLEWEELLICY